MYIRPNKTLAFPATRENKGQKDFPSKKAAGKSGWNLFTIIIIGLGLISGCGGGPSRQVLSAQTLAQLPPPKKTAEDSQAQMMLQASRLPLSNYKDYQVGPEDLVEVTFLGNDELWREVRVNGRGEISMPLVGMVQVNGLSPQEIEGSLAKLYKDGKFLRNPQITVSVKEFRHKRVMVTGAVANPGSYEMIGPRTLLEMLGKAGGLSDRTSEKAGNLVYIIRNQSASALTKVRVGDKIEPFSPGSETTVIDLRRLLTGGALELNIPIKNGDVIYVPPARMAYILGAVKKPCQVPIKDNLTVVQAVALAEGQDPLLSSNNITVVRFDDQGQRVIIPVNLKGVTSGTEPDPVLKENDIVFVQESGLRRFMFDIKTMMPGSLGASVPFY